MTFISGPELERKYCSLGAQLELGADATISGYASLFGEADQGGDVVEPGAYAASLKRLSEAGLRVKLLWQHDPATPIGVWDRVHEDARGLFVEGRLLTETQKGREAAALIEAGAIDGLSIGYRTIKAKRCEKGLRRLSELELWEVSLVTFPMLPQARVHTSVAGGAGAGADAKQQPSELHHEHELAGVLRTLRQNLADFAG